MKSRDSMVLYRSFYDAIKLLPDDIQLEIFKAIFEFGLDGVEPELSKSALPFWLLIKPNLQANRTKWESGSKAKTKQSGSKTEAKHKKEVSKVEANVDVDVDVDVDEDADVECKIKKPKFDLSSFTDLAYLVQRWIDYRKSIKKPYKSQDSLDAFVKSLRKMAGDNVQQAESIIEQSIANQWQGIFSIKNNNEQNRFVPAEQPARKITLHESFTLKTNKNEI